jgi:chromosome segregation ATPase
MFTGRHALSSIERAIGTARANEGRLDAALRSAIDEAARLRRQETDGFRALARIKLDAMMSDRVVGDLDSTERRALAMIEGRRQEIEALARRRDQAQAALEAAEAAKHERDQELADAIEALDELRERTEQEVRADDSWQAAIKALEAVEQVAANAERKAADAEADLAVKRKPYEDDPIFMYLWNRKHGESEDRSGSFVRFFDRKAARLIGYGGARANYAMLQEIPKRLREHATNKQNDVAAAQKQLADVERAALVAKGVEPVETRLAAAQAQAKSAGEEVLKITAELQRIEIERQKLVAAGDDALMNQATELLADALSRENVHALYQEAKRTATRGDDQAIAVISAAREKLQKTDREVAQIRDEMRELARRRSELEGARDRARRSGYDDPRGTLRTDAGDIIGGIIGGILAGTMQGGSLDDMFRRDYRGPRRRSRGNFGHPRGQPSWPDWGRGGLDTWGRGGGTGGGGDKGWRTGGSF